MLDYDLTFFNLSRFGVQFLYSVLLYYKHINQRGVTINAEDFNKGFGTFQKSMNVVQTLINVIIFSFFQAQILLFRGLVFDFLFKVISFRKRTQTQLSTSKSVNNQISQRNENYLLIQFSCRVYSSFNPQLSIINCCRSSKKSIFVSET